MSIPIAGGQATPLAGAQTNPGAITNDATRLFWVNQAEAGRIMKLVKP